MGVKAGISCSNERGACVCREPAGQEWRGPCQSLPGGPDPVQLVCHLRGGNGSPSWKYLGHFVGECGSNLHAVMLYATPKRTDFASPAGILLICPHLTSACEQHSHSDLNCRHDSQVLNAVSLTGSDSIY